MNLAEKLVMRPIGEAFGFTNRILGPRSVCARLYVVRPHQVFGGRDGFAETAFAEMQKSEQTGT